MSLHSSDRKHGFCSTLHTNWRCLGPLFQGTSYLTYLRAGVALEQTQWPADCYRGVSSSGSQQDPMASMILIPRPGCSPSSCFSSRLEKGGPVSMPPQSQSASDKEGPRFAH